MLYALAHPLVRFLAWIFFRLKVIGEENVPRTGGVIVAANHNSYLDIPLLGCALTRRADNIAKAELFGNRFVAAIFRTLGGFPVQRGDRGDRGAVEEAVRRLRKGHLLALYPEGRRSPDGRLLSPKPGIGMLVARTRVPVVPVYIDGTGKALPPGQRSIRRARVTITFGKPIDFGGRHLDQEAETGVEKKGAGGNRKEVYLEIAEEIMRQIGALRPDPEA
jgi:1-acyl-sn-glycerol-3-phosphate acyltransferase